MLVRGGSYELHTLLKVLRPVGAVRKVANLSLYKRHLYTVRMPTYQSSLYEPETQIS